MNVSWIELHDQSIGSVQQLTYQSQHMQNKLQITIKTNIFLIFNVFFEGFCCHVIRKGWKCALMNLGG